MKIARISLLVLIAIAMLSSAFARAACQPGQMANLTMPAELTHKNQDSTVQKIVMLNASAVHVIGVKDDDVEIYAMETPIGSALGTVKTNLGYPTISCQ